MLGSKTNFADANSPLDEAEFVILGVPFDATSSFRSGSKFAPNRIREASYNLETYISEYKVDLLDVKIHDAGNMEEYLVIKELWEDIEHVISGLSKNKMQFPIAIGGEHSITPPVVKALKPKAAIVIDAHMDYRSEYLGLKGNHACATRRICDTVGPEHVVVIGVRSFTKEEEEDAIESGLKYFTAEHVREYGVGPTIQEAHRHLYEETNDGAVETYLSLDIDGIDPAFAPGTGTPEPYGLTHLEAKKIIASFTKYLVGFDVVEVCPPYDNGNTSMLAAKIIRDVIASVWMDSLFVD